MLVQKLPGHQEKPFACTAKGCDMTFINKDHLEWHNKKHEMMLNLGLVNKNNEVADQTPTPTRFIRNCEEVGLFQDLQNVNPFDEIFKKAADLAKNGVTIDFQANNSDDTLHTPHILPHITDYPLKSDITRINHDSDSEIFDFPTNDTSDSDDTIIVDVVGDSNIKKKLKDNILNKKLPLIKVVPFQDLCHSPEEKNNNFKENKLASLERSEKIREMNRAAQLRCRRRKQQVWKEMEQEVVSLKAENKKLKLELELLKVQHSKCLQNIPNQGTIITSVFKPESSKASDSSSALPTQIPLLIQLIPNTQLLVRHPTETVKKKDEILPTNSKENNATKRGLRKIAPRLPLNKKLANDLLKESG